MNKRSEIPNLLRKLVFLSPEVRSNLLSQYKTISEEKVIKIYDFLIKALKNQEAVVAKEIKKNPQILIKAKEKVMKEKMRSLYKKESNSRSKELRELASLDEELNKII